MKNRRIENISYERGQHMKVEWQEIHCTEDTMENVFMSTYRAKVIGGWIVRQEMLIDADRENIHDGWSNVHNSMVFVPDPTHSWSIEE